MISHSKPFLIDEDYLAIQKVLQSGMIAEGGVVADFENAVAEYLGVLGGIATSSGTMALFLALKVLDISHRAKVIIPTYVCRAVLDEVNYTGADETLSNSCSTG